MCIILRFMKTLQTTGFFRKLLAGSLSFFLLSSNFSFLGTQFPDDIAPVSKVQAGFTQGISTSLASSGNTFTGSSFLSSYTGSQVNT